MTRNGPTFFDLRVNGVVVSSGNLTSVNAWDPVTIPFLVSGSSALIEIAGYGGTAGLAVTAGWAIDKVTLTGCDPDAGRFGTEVRGGGMDRKADDC